MRLNMRMTQTTEPNSRTAAATSFNISWPALSIGLAIIAVVSLGTLAVIVSVKNVDILSTVALAIAILSFAAQLIVSLLQTESSAKLNGSTGAALAEMRATTESLLTNQSEQFDTVLRAALSVVPEAVQDIAASSSGESEDGPALSTQASSDALVESMSKRILQLLDRPSVARPQAEVQVTSDLDSYPDQESGTAAYALLSTLSPTTIPQLLRLAGRVRTAEKQSKLPRATYRQNASGQPGPLNRELMDKGLILRHTTEDGYVHYELTETGKAAARLLLPSGPRPQWLVKLMS